LIAELERLRGEHQWFYRLAHEQPPEPDHAHGEAAHPSPVRPEVARREVAAREHRMRALTEQLYVRSQTGDSGLPAPAVSLGAIQQALEANTLLVEYY